MNVRTYTGTLAALNDVVTADVSDCDEAAWSIVGTWTGTISFEVTNNGTDWTLLFSLNAATGVAVSTTTTINAAWINRNLAASRSIRIRLSTLGTGSGDVALTVGRLGRG
jgi:hypothetical protein